MYSPAVGACAEPSAAMLFQDLFVDQRRHRSASQFTFMHTTIVTSIAGQLRPGTTLAAITSIVTATPIFNISQNMKPAAADTAEADFVLALRVIPRASKALGRTVATAP